MQCPKCQFENPYGIKFCGECGTKLERICPSCNSTNPPQFKFCGECGHDLKKPEEAPPIDYTQPQSYTPKFLADKILNSRSSIEGERKLVTVLFADVANYTSVIKLNFIDYNYHCCPVKVLGKRSCLGSAEIGRFRF